MNNLYEYGEFKTKKNGVAVNESAAQLFDSEWRVRTKVSVSTKLINEFSKKIQSETGEDIRKKYSEQELAEEIANYVTTAFLAVENLPVSIVTNIQQEPKVQTQGEASMPAQTQVQETPAQPQAQAEVPAQQPEAQTAQAAQAAPAQQPAQGTAQNVAQKIPQAEI